MPRAPLVLFLVATTAAAVAGCKEEKPIAAAKIAMPAVQPVQVVKVAFAPRGETWSYVGVVRARIESDLGFRVAGKIIERRVDIGQRVAAGDVLARLDPTDLRLAFETQEAERRAAVSVRNAAAAAEVRFKQLFAAGHVAQAALDQRVSAADEARARLDRADRALEIARNQLSYAELKADRAGLVSLLPVEVGQVVAAGQLIARVAEPGALEAVIAVPENRIETVTSATATAAVWGGDGTRHAARLREVSPEADRVTRTYKVRFAIDAPPGTLQLGRTITVHLARGEPSIVAALPLAAVVNDGRGAAVWVVASDGTRVTRRAVSVTSFGQDQALVTTGLETGERVVSLGAHMLDPGKPVRIVEEKS
jgi:RND family efflux transporter MFP subunit